MRRVIIRGTPPQDWINDANAVTAQLRAAADELKRAEIIKKKEDLWRDDRIRNWLSNQFKNKCWYSEAYDSVSPIHVDHYRPKGRVRDLDGNEGEGYWWLAFDWENYRICGQLINIKKNDIFPITEGTRANFANPISLHLEAPVIIDPLKDESRLISYEKDEDACIAVPAAGINEAEKYRAEKTIEVIGLNRLAKLNQKRADFWDDCLMAITEYRSAEGPQAFRLVTQASVLNQLKKKVSYEAEFSSVTESCIRKHAPDPLIASVFEVKNNAQVTASNFSQTSGSSTAELLQLITTMRQTAAQFPREIQDDIIIDVDDVEEEIKKPENQRNLTRLRKRLMALATVGSMITAPVAGITDFANNAIYLGNKLGIELQLPSAP